MIPYLWKRIFFFFGNMPCHGSNVFSVFSPTEHRIALDTRWIVKFSFVRPGVRDKPKIEYLTWTPRRYIGWNTLDIVDMLSSHWYATGVTMVRSMNMLLKWTIDCQSRRYGVLSVARAAGKKNYPHFIRFVKQLWPTSKQSAIYEPENSVFTIWIFHLNWMEIFINLNKIEIDFIWLGICF